MPQNDIPTWEETSEVPAAPPTWEDTLSEDQAQALDVATTAPLEMTSRVNRAWGVGEASMQPPEPVPEPPRRRAIVTRAGVREVPPGEFMPGEKPVGVSLEETAQAIPPGKNFVTRPLFSLAKTGLGFAAGAMDPKNLPAELALATPLAPAAEGYFAYQMGKGAVKSVNDIIELMGQTGPVDEAWKQKMSDAIVNAEAAGVGTVSAGVGAKRGGAELIRQARARLAASEARAVPPGLPPRGTTRTATGTTTFDYDPAAAPAPRAPAPAPAPKPAAVPLATPEAEAAEQARLAAELGQEEEAPAPAQPAAAKVTPADLEPALLVNGKPVTGGASHEEIMRNALATADDPVVVAKAFADDKTHVFVDKSGQVYTRREAADALGEEKNLHSERLSELKKKVTPTLPETAAGERALAQQIDKAAEAQTPPTPTYTGADATLILGKPLGYWFTVTDEKDLPKGSDRKAFAKRIGVANKPAKILAALKNSQRRIREIVSPPLSPEQALPATQTTDFDKIQRAQEILEARRAESLGKGETYSVFQKAGLTAEQLRQVGELSLAEAKELARVANAGNLTKENFTAELRKAKAAAARSQKGAAIDVQATVEPEEKAPASTAPAPSQIPSEPPSESPETTPESVTPAMGSEPSVVGPSPESTGVKGKLSWEWLNERDGKWHQVTRPLVISKSLVPGGKPWTVTVFGGPEDAPVPIGQTQLDAPELTEEAMRTLASQVDRNVRRMKFKAAAEPKSAKAATKAPEPETKPAEALAVPAEEAKEPTSKPEIAAEPAAKAQEEVSKVAATEGQRPAKEVKTELAKRVEDAMQGAPEKLLYDEKKHGVVEINIPGDGNFKVPRNQEALSEMLRKVKRITTTPTKPEKIPISKDTLKEEADKVVQAYGGAENAYRSTKRQRDALPDNDPETPAKVESADALLGELFERTKAGKLESEAEKASELAQSYRAGSESFRTAIARVQKLKRKTKAHLEELADLQRRYEENQKRLTEYETTAERASQEAAKERAALDAPQATEETPPSMGPGAASRAEFRARENRRRLLANITGFLFGDRAGEATDALLRKLAGEAVPKTMALSGESGNKMVRFAAATTAAPHMARAMTREVLEDHFTDKPFRRRLGAVLVEDRLRAIRRGFMQLAREATDPAAQARFQAQADDVNSLVGPGRVFENEAAFRRELADPEIRGAIERHKQTIQTEAELYHTEADGTLAGPGVNTGAFINLQPIFEDSPGAIFTSSRKGDYTRPFKRRSVFSRRAKGSADVYELDYQPLAERMLKGNYEEFTKRELYDQLVQDNLASVLPSGEPRPTFDGKPGEKFQIKRQTLVTTRDGQTRVIPQYENLWVHPEVAHELRQAEHIGSPINNVALARFASVINRVQLALGTDAVWHIGNEFAKIAGSQGGKNLLVDLARKVPLVNVIDTITRVTIEARRILKNDPEVLNQIAELAQIGNIRVDKPGGGRVTRLVNLLDKAGRVVLDDFYKNLANRGKIVPSEVGRREWGAQLGQYNPRLMGQLEGFFKEAGLSPFIVAGRNFNRMALRKMTLSPGVRAANWKAGLEMRAVEFFGVVATLVAVPTVINSITTGHPAGRPGVPIGAIDTGRDDANGKHIYIDPSQWIGLRRGMRITGVNAMLEGMVRGQPWRQIRKQMAHDIIGAVVHPWAGPIVQMGSVLGTGYTTAFYKESKDPGDYYQNFLAAMKQINPLVHGWFQRQGKGVVGGLESAVTTFGGAAGVKTRAPLSAVSQVHDLANGWASRSQDPRIRSEYEQHAKENFSSEYQELRSALLRKDLEGARAAYRDLREKGKKPSVIAQTLKHPHPFTGSARSENMFKASLNDKERALYKQAEDERRQLYQAFRQMLNSQ